MKFAEKWGIELSILLGWPVFHSTKKCVQINISLLKRSIFSKIEGIFDNFFYKMKLWVGFGFGFYHMHITGRCNDVKCFGC